MCRPGSQPAQVAGEGGPELQSPAPNRFVRGLDAALGQEFLDIAVAEREAELEPDCMLDDLGRELVAGVGDGLHGAPYRASSQPVHLAVTAPEKRRATVGAA